jgi:hypothetical protein
VAGDAAIIVAVMRIAAAHPFGGVDLRSTMPEPARNHSRSTAILLGSAGDGGGAIACGGVLEWIPARS